MKKRTLLLMLAAAMVCLCGAASAASLITGGDTLSGQVPIGYVTDSTGARVDALTDGNTVTSWTRPLNGGSPDLTLTMYGASVGEIWIRSGHCYSQNYYNHYDRPETIAVTLWYHSGRYATNSVTYRYRMTDAFRPDALSAGWNGGYQRLLLPARVDGVDRIELTIESAITGYGRTGATLTDIAVTSGQHATATPNRATATPRPQQLYITPTPGPTQSWVEVITPQPQVEVITARPTQSLVEYLTPRPTQPLVEYLTPRPTQPLVEAITPRPTQSSDYPSAGIEVTLNQRISAWTGPYIDYMEIGNFFGAGDRVNVVGKCQDGDGLWWYCVEFKPKSGKWMRGYTTARRTDLDPETAPVPYDWGPTTSATVLETCQVYYGPGYDFQVHGQLLLEAGDEVDVCQFQNGWAQVQFDMSYQKVSCRVWVPVEMLYLK